ncbi:MAG: alkaline phosphatase family protein, partial [Myxococcales bacterium]|nr:alkaline phosphatase family protein [Myxococcales bacterium]
RVSSDQRAGLLRVYQALDEAVGRLIDAAGSQTEITLLSDHGSGGSSDKVLYLNRLLAEHGLLSFKTGSRRVGARLKELALRSLPPGLRERLFRMGNAWLPGRLESHVRFGAIDMQRTTAFSDELNYFPGIYLNMAGREPKGTVRRDEKHETSLRIRTALLSVRDPWTGRPVFRDVVRREELFDGPYLERAPDLLLDFHLDGEYSYNLMPSASAPTEHGAWRLLTDREKLGKKGRSLPGSHRSHGFLAIDGPQVVSVGRIDAHIADVTATLLARLGVVVPSSFRGRVLWNALEASDAAEALPSGDRQRSGVRRNEAAVEARLRALGYVE